MSSETSSKISWWKIRAQNERDPFVKLFILYMCLDAWMTSGSNEDSDTKKLKWLRETDNPLREYWKQTPNLTVPLNGLKGVGKIEDMRPNHRGEFKYLTDVSNFSEVVDFIYQIRCNLFHGGKSYNNADDRKLCRWAADITYKWLEWTLLKTSR